MELRGVVLWLHVLAGLGWVGAAASFGFASAALAGPGREWRDFALRVAPRLNRLGLGCAAIVPLTGVANLAFAIARRPDPVPLGFLRLVGVKLGLYAIMAGLLWRATIRVAAFGVAATNRAVAPDASQAELRSLVRIYALIAAAGGIAALLGLWLAGIN